MKWRRITVMLALSGILSASLFASGQSDAADGTGASGTGALVVTPSGYPVVNEPITMSIATIRPANGGDSEQMWFWKYMENLTGITMDVQQVQQQTQNEQLNVMFATGEVPDMFLTVPLSNLEIMQYGMDQGFLIPLEELIDSHAPNIKAAIEERPDTFAKMKTPDGKLYHLPGWRGAEGTYAINRVFYNTQWMENLGLERPETPDELIVMLKAFKEQDPNGNGEADEIPLSAASDQMPALRSTFLAAYGLIMTGTISTDAMAAGSLMGILNDEAVFYPSTAAYRNYLSVMAGLWEDGLLDPDMFTQTMAQFRAKGSGGVYGMASDGAPWLFSGANYLEWEPYEPVAENGTPVWTAPVDDVPSGAMITVKCEYPEAAIRWLDWFFDKDEAYMYSNLPPLGSKEAEMGGMTKFGRIIDENGQKAWILPDDVANSGYNFLCMYGAPHGAYPPGYAQGFDETEKYAKRFGLSLTKEPVNRIGVYEMEAPIRGVLARLSAADKELILSYYGVNGSNYILSEDASAADRKKIFEILDKAGLYYDRGTGVPEFWANKAGSWRKGIYYYVQQAFKSGFPEVYVSGDNLLRIQEISIPLNDYLTQMEAKFIVGRTPLSEFDNFLEEMKKLGSDEYEKIYKDAYAQFRNNLD